MQPYVLPVLKVCKFIIFMMVVVIAVTVVVFMMVVMIAIVMVIIERFSKDDVDVKDDVKMAWCAHLWMCHAISTSSLTSTSSC